jgi:2-polyprenyl-3-methyl-5-hydroxy-6-metoxy-1,4-benzoquinol methylase
MPGSEELRQFYQNKYRLEYKGVTSPRPKHVVRAGRLALERIRCLQAQVGAAQRSLIDLGAGGGEFVYLYKTLGLGPVCGVEPNRGYCEHARLELGVEVSPTEMSQVTGTYHTVTMFHVLEHLTDPLSVFEKLHSLLEPGGVLFLEVPSVEEPGQSPTNSFFKAHTLYFSEASLTAVASACFEKMWSDTSTGCLRAVFRRRDKPVPPRLPDPDAVKLMGVRLRQRTWSRYLLRGGASGPVRKLIRNLREIASVQGSARQSLDRLAQRG